MRVLLAWCALGDIALILPPKDTQGRPASLVLIGGAQIPNTAYAPLVAAWQDAASARGVSLYAGVPWYLGDFPEPADMKYRVDDVMQKLAKAGLPADAPQFFAAHSLGTVFLQDFVAQRQPAPAGQVLMGGFLLRKHVTPNVTYAIPTLTLGGELDGLARVTRIAESLYHQRGREDLPVAVLPGVNHMGFASGPPPANVRAHDLPAELSAEAMHAAVAAVAADFLAARSGARAQGDLARVVASTAEFLDPVLAAYALEGSRRFGAPAQVGGDDEKRCVRGLCPAQSPWAPTAQEVISRGPVEAAGFKLGVTNAYVELSGSPATGKDFHLPNVTVAEHTVHITTYSQGYWNDPFHEVFDNLDTGFTYTSAQEIATKLYSRQCTQNVGLGANVSFAVDDPDFCAQTNQQAYDWALAHAPAASAARFKAKGRALVMAKDVPTGAGPLWIGSRLSFKPGQSDGRPVMEVASPTCKTDQDYWRKHFPFPKPAFLPDPGCYHYCKLLSPARALEWVLVDGLRAPAESALIV